MIEPISKLVSICWIQIELSIDELIMMRKFIMVFIISLRVIIVMLMHLR